MPTANPSPKSGEHLHAETSSFQAAAAHESAVRWRADFKAVGQLLVAWLVPGIPFVVARILLHQHSGVLNIDYLLLTVLACAWSVRLASVLFVLTYLLESLRMMDAIYFFTQQDLTFAAHFITEVPRWLVASWALTFVAFTVGSLKLWQLLLPRLRGAALWRPTAALGAFVMVMLVADVSQGFNPLLKLPHASPRHHLVGELLLRMPVEIARISPDHQGATTLSASATAPLWADSVIRQRHQNVVVVVVESMGLLQDEAGMQKELSLLTDSTISQHYTVSQGTVPFSGGTVSGEMRELCHLSTGVRITDVTLAGHAPCLPSQFHDLGYQVVAFHGFRGTMFRREEWYPKLGFEQSTFLEKLKNIPMCNGAFYGACDAGIADMLDSRLQQAAAGGAPPQFLYWMSLNSHLPVDVNRAPTGSCPIRADAEVCAQLSYVQQVLKAVRKLALDPKIGPTAIVVVGDHAPPYISVLRRDLFDDTRVPFLTLMPRS